MAFLTVWLYTLTGETVWSIWSAFEVLVYNISYSVALYALVMFYLAIKNTPTIDGIRPLPKFVAVKIIVFATYWQTIFILLLCPGMPHDLVRRWNSFILCIECPVAAVLQAWAFPHVEFMQYEESVKTSEPAPIRTVDEDLEAGLESNDGAVSLSSESVDAKDSRKGKRLQAITKSWSELKDKQSRKLAFTNAKDAFGVGDVMEDAVFSFKSRYAKHARLANAYDDDAVISADERSLSSTDIQPEEA
eukprot:Blabericola_migrator_1__2130@NODE_1588_length_4223_cov_110_912175_g1038_i0_p1_GENE_NODE_1588_length_4223_cov_110_912175_g1038_i0NODE_1588_length_4223_cov_110_912175_g1038_i0_p1_ORF_typecomplete_len247_score36_48Solute_trans_a/PF03619_16/6_1e23_NODE_1588_length_4223_cov_110_912175_g1038_i024073147